MVTHHTLTALLHVGHTHSSVAHSLACVAKRHSTLHTVGVCHRTKRIVPRANTGGGTEGVKRRQGTDPIKNYEKNSRIFDPYYAGNTDQQRDSALPL